MYIYHALIMIHINLNMIYPTHESTILPINLRFTSRIIFSVFNRSTSCCLSVVMWPEAGDFPENLHRIVYVIISKRSFESFMCLDLIDD